VGKALKAKAECYMLKLKPVAKRPDPSCGKNGKKHRIDMLVQKIGNIGYIIDSQQLSWQYGVPQRFRWNKGAPRPV
jgi:hypothetical protein